MFAQQLASGIGEAVAKRTILRKKANGHLETWANVAERVALGNTLLLKNVQNKFTKEEYENHFQEEKRLLEKHISQATLLMSGRHLQHGDETQPERNQEVFTNCSTAGASFLSFYLLMNGSGVGRAYDDDLMLIDWEKNLPNIKVVLDESHPNFDYMHMESLKEGRRKYKEAMWFEVPDTREGWAQAVERLEILTWEGKYNSTLFVLDFSKVRPSGSPIKGMQNRPASGPAPLMRAFQNVASLKGSGMSHWEATMWVDHYFAECVLVGGARRSARIATKVWTDKEIIDFVKVKQGGFLWSANNSIAVDDEFWKQDTKEKKDLLKETLQASYHDGTGEPGFINQHKLVQKDDGIEMYKESDFVGSLKYNLTDQAKQYMRIIAKKAMSKKYTQITNPCGEISLHLLGGYCVIADVVPYFASNDEEAEEAFRTVTRALIRVNTMDSLYKKEVARTNRIRIGLTGIHEYAWKRFKLDFNDLIDEKKSKEFWLMLSRFKRAVDEEAENYSVKIGANIPHTNTTIKPAGTTSKLFALSEGAHLPAMREYLRWVQFRSDDPMVKEYEHKGYPSKELKTYRGSTIIGFPTQPEICKLGMGERLVTAGDATPEQQYKWLMLLEKYWIQGINITQESEKELDSNTGNQVSYTLKYKPEMVNFKEYSATVRQFQPQIRCCSVMPQIDATAYEYQPEQPITRSYYNQLVRHIEYNGLKEDVDFVHVDCEGGACPVDFYKDEL